MVTKNRVKVGHYVKQCGFSLVYVIGALVALSAIAAGVTIFTPSSTMTEVYENNLLQAYYAAYSGINYAKTLSGTALSNLVTVGETSYTLDDGLSFSLTVSAKDGTTGKYPVMSVGKALLNSALAGNYVFNYEVTPHSSMKRPESLSKTNNAPYVQVAGTVTGNVMAKEVTIASGSKITGTLTSTSTTKILSLTGGVNIGNTICSSDGVSIDGGSTVANGDVVSHGDVTISGGATINGNIYATGSVTINGGSTVNGNIYSGGAVNFNQGVMGAKDRKGNITRRYTYALETVTLAGGNDLYIDVHTQQNVVLNGITVHGDVYDLTGMTKPVSWSQLDGHEYHNPTKPKNTPDCDSLTKVVMGDFPETEDGPKSHVDTTFAAGDYYLNSFNLDNWQSTRVCFDTSGGDINIFVDANVLSGAQIYVKTASNGNCFSGGNLMDSTTETFASAAAKVFLYTSGSFTLYDGAHWFGTVLAEKDIQPGSGSNIIGSLHSNGGTINPRNVWFNINEVDLGP